MSFGSKIRITNSTKFKKMIVLEPWAEVYEILPEQAFEFVAQSEYEGNFEIDFDGEYEGVESITIYAWSGCVVEVLFEGENISGAGHIKVFDVPLSLSLSEFTKKFFGNNE
jgi:hypothetical protein